MIPIAKPSIGEEEISEIKKVFASGWLGMGSVVYDFENALKDYLGAKHIIAVNTGTSALHISLDSLKVKNSDEVITPSLTFTAAIQAILACGAKPVFCEINSATLNIDIKDVERRITPMTKAIMPVHFGGLSCDMDRLLQISQDKNIRIIEDAAHAFGSTYKGKKIGSFGDITCFSFDPIKNITCGEGGAVVLSDEILAQEILRKRILGIDKDTWHRYKNERSWLYEVVTSGFRYHMSNINAAIGLIQLKKIDKFLIRKREIVKKYDEAFKNVADIELLNRNYEETAPFNYIIKIKNGRRDELMDYLTKNGIGVGIHYIPNHLQPLFKDFRTELPITEKVYKEIISLPLYFSMSEDDVVTVIDRVKFFFKKSIDS